MRVHRSPPRRAAAALAAMLVLAACSTGSTPSPASSTSTPAPTQAGSSGGSQASASPTGGASGAVRNLDGVQGATIQIEAQGTYVDPQVGQQSNAGWSGSGFFIDPSGLAITNNHVVTGAAILKVWIGGNQDQSYNAQVLGASECSDLALIRVLGVDHVPYLAWYTQPIDTGLQVYAAGFPLGDPTYTLKQGIVSKAKADGNTTWASIDSVIEHDAATLPGNSGGPLVTSNGQVVGVTFASDQAGERFAVSEAEIQKVLPDFKQNKDVTSIGVNGQAVADDASGIYGIWVSSVKSGSPADEAGVQPGDIITRLEGLVLSTDGTMGDYCSILRSHAADAKLSIEVLRYSTNEVLQGQLNGRQLAVVTSIGGNQGNNGTAGGTAVEYVKIQGTSGILSMEVPKTWTDISRSAKWDFKSEGNTGVGLTASPNIQKWNDGWTTPGVFFGASSSLASKYTDDEILDRNDWSDECTKDGRFDYSDGTFTGRFDRYTKCGGGDTTFIVLAAAPDTGRDYVIYLQLQAVTSADLDTADHIAQTMSVNGTVP